jgi:hypothetical protein
MTNCIKHLFAFLIIYSLSCQGILHAQNETLNDWGVIDPWEDFCTDLELSNNEEKLLTNIGSKAFTWLTGTQEQAEYEPIGELANYFGFAKLRNEIRDSSDNPLADENLRGSSWLVVLEHLEANQREILYEAAMDQEYDFSSFLDERVSLIRMLYALKNETKIILQDAIQHVDAMSTHEANISHISAEAFGEVSISLTNSEKDFFSLIRQGNLIVSELVGLGPYAAEVADEITMFSSFQKELLKETSSKFLSYETGSLEDAIYLPPGKIGNFFGFAHYRYEERAAVSRSQASELLFSVLTESQKDKLRCLTKQVYDFEQEYITARAQLITDLYPLKSGIEINGADAIEDYIMDAISEGKMGIVQAIYFDFLERMLSDTQIQELQTLRANTGDGTTSTSTIEGPMFDFSIAPVPFDNTIRVKTHSTQAGVMELLIYNLQGHLMTRIEQKIAVGHQTLHCNSSDYPKGSYFYTITLKSHNALTSIDSGYVLKL